MHVCAFTSLHAPEVLLSAELEGGDNGTNAKDRITCCWTALAGLHVTWLSLNVTLDNTYIPAYTVSG